MPAGREKLLEGSRFGSMSSGPFPHGPPSPIRPRQRPGGGQGKADSDRGDATTCDSITSNGTIAWLGEGVAQGSAEGQDAVAPRCVKDRIRGGGVSTTAATSPDLKLSLDFDTTSI